MTSDELKKTLRRSAVTHQQVADACGQSRSYVTRQINGEVPMTPACGAAVEELLFGVRAQQARLIRDFLRREGEFAAAETVDRVCIG